MKITKFQTLRFQTTLVSALLLFVLIVLLGISIKKAFDTKKQTGEYEIRNKISGLLNVAAGWQAIERGYGATIIGSGKGESSSFFSKFIEMAKRGDSKVFLIEKELEKLLSARSDKALEKILIKWRKGYESLISARLKISSNDISKDEWLDIATLNIRNEFNLRNTAFTPQHSDEKILYLNNVLRPNIAILCEYAGLERALISNTIESGMPFSQETVNRIKRYRSIIDQSLDQIMVLKESPSTSIRMKQAIDVFENEFLQSYDTLKEEVFASSKRLESDIKIVKEKVDKRNIIYLNYLHGIKTDLLNISNNKNVIALARSLSLSAEEDIRLHDQLGVVENLFNSFSQVKRVYDQVRFLDNIGYERVRVDFDGNATNIIRGAKLQDKSERYYFNETINLPQGSVYISPLDLNIEHGSIELPYKPVMRYATPVFVDGERAGVIIFDLLADTPYFLHKLTENEGELDYILAGQDGFYLHHTDKAKEWGMMELLNRSHQNIREDYPDEAGQILSGGEGSVHMASGSVMIYKPFFYNSEAGTGNFWVIIKQVKGVDYPVSSSVWFNKATEVIDKGLAISSIAGDEANSIMLEMESAAKRNMLISYFILGFAVFVFVYFFRWSRNRVLKPIQRLTGITQEIAEGGFSYRADVKLGDEIGVLAENFNLMADELTNDITLRKQAEKRLSAQFYITKVLAESVTIKEASPRILQAVCTALEWDLGEIWEFDRQDYMLRCSEIWHIASLNIEEFKEVTRQITFAKGVGLPGRVFKSAQPAWIEDVVRDTNFPRASAADRAGLHGAFGFPILSGSEVFGAICFYSREIRQPDEDLLGMLLSIGIQIGLFIKKRRAEEEIKKMAKFPSENPHPVIRVHKNGDVLYNNQASLTLLGFWDYQTTRIVPDKVLTMVSEVLRTGISRIVEMEFNNCIFSLTFAPVIEEGYVNIYGLDITERKNMESALVHTEKLKSLGEITAGVAHEFNNILSIIIGSAEVLEGGFKDEESLKRGLSDIIRAGDDGAEIVKRMLTFAKAEAVDTSNYIFTDIRHLIKEAIDFTAPMWKNIALSKGITYHIDTEGIKEVPELFCNPTELKEVLVNMINNAMDAMPDGGSITFSVRSDENTVFVSVSDTGKGMSEEVKKQMFDPFFTTRRPEGTGLGMSVSYGVIKRHNGKIEVESEEGKGTTFNMSIPICKEAVQGTVISEPAREIKKKLHILVVDDEKAICENLDGLFSREGHSVKSVNNGAEAIELAGKEAFDLVLCDLAMPEVTGHDVIRALNKLEKRPKIGIITGWNEKLTLEEGESGPDFIVKKPFKLLELAKQINDVFGAD